MKKNLLVGVTGNIANKLNSIVETSKEKLGAAKEKLIDAWNGVDVVAHEFRKNFMQIVSDVESGKAFEDGALNDNAKNTLLDMAKMAGVGAIFVLPGGSAGVVALKKFLDSDKAKKMGIPNFLELSIAMKTCPLNPMPEVPHTIYSQIHTFSSTPDGAFGRKRTHDIHTGVDLYCEPGAKVHAIECGEVVAILDFTGLNAESPWWNDTRAVMVEGNSGVFVYGEIKERDGLKVGDNVECGDVLGEVVTVLKKDKGNPMTMLHIELYEHKTRDVVWWKLDEKKPTALLDPTNILMEIKSKS
jgi:hypothetical protein